VPALSQALRADPDPAVRRAAAEALGRLAGPETADALIRALREPPGHGCGTGPKGWV